MGRRPSAYDRKRVERAEGCVRMRKKLVAELQDGAKRHPAALGLHFDHVKQNNRNKIPSLAVCSGTLCI